MAGRDLAAAVRSASILLLFAACAQVEPPRGGPPDLTPPSVIATAPESDVVVEPFSGPVIFQFDERISERGLDETVIVSPRTSPVEIRHGRDELRVSLRQGWQPGFIYQVILRPEVSDLFGNRLAEPASVVFSTGPPIPDTESAGRVTDRITGQRTAGIRVEAIRGADSLVYAVPTDSAGGFRFSRIPEGDYTIRAFDDVNRNRSLEEFEPRDSASVAIAEGEPVGGIVLRLLMPDTTPPVATTARRAAGVVEVEFDDYLDPEQSLTPEQVTLTGPAGSVAISGLRLATQTPVPDPAAAPDPDEPPPADVAAPPEPLPSRTLVLEPASEAEIEAPGEYVVEIRGIRNVNGLTGDSEATLTIADDLAGGSDSFAAPFRDARLVAAGRRTVAGR